MALQAESPATTYTPHVVGAAFVKQYYQTLRYNREETYKFYNDSSILGRSDSNGNMKSVTTIDAIKRQLLSADFTDCLIELETLDSQPSHVDGVLILVAGSFTIDAVKQKFTQSFFLAPQGAGYFVLNDMLRFARPSTEMKEIKANHDNESTCGTTLPSEPETASIKESMDPHIPPTENIVPVNAEVMSPSTNVVSEVQNDASQFKNDASQVENDASQVENDASQVENDASQVKNVAVVETCLTVVNKDIEKIPEVAPAPPSAEKEVTKKTYASIVKTMRENIPLAPVAKPKPKPNPRPKAAQNAEKSVPSPSEPAHATSTAPPSDKNVSKNKSPDGPGYSVFVKNLPYEATVEMVGQEFGKFGAIKSGGIQVKKSQFDQFCFGFVEFESEHSMQAAIEASTVYFGSWQSYIEEKRTKTRVVDGVITRGDDNGNGGSYRGQGGFRNNGYYNNGDNRRSDSRNHNGNGYPQNRNGYHQNRNGNGYPQNGNGYQQRRPLNNGNGKGNGNGRAERSNGPRQQTPVAS